VATDFLFARESDRTRLTAHRSSILTYPGKEKTALF